MYSNFEAIVKQAIQKGTKRIMAVAAAEDEPVIQAAVQAKKDGIVDVIFVGNAEKISEILQTQGEDPANYEIVGVPPEETAQVAVAMVRDGTAHFLMKGLIDTKLILGAVVKKENNLRTGRVMSHVGFFELPGYHKLIACSDGAMLVYPTLEDKKGIIENAVATLRAIGYQEPKVGVLAGVEKVNPKMRETTDAEALMQMNQSGEIAGCVIEGPVSYDVAMSKEIASHKGVDYKHCGDYDLLVVPDMTSGNIMGKSWTVTAGGKLAGIIVGAKVPIVLPSRGSTAEEKYLSIVLAAVTSAGTEM